MQSELSLKSETSVPTLYANANDLPMLRGYDSFAEIERRFAELIETEDLDARIKIQPDLTRDFDKQLERALELGYETSEIETTKPEVNAARLFTQRALYRINRLKLFWYDDLRRYTNERSDYLRSVRDRIETVWLAWELSQLDIEAMKNLDFKQAVHERAAADLNPPPSEAGLFFRDEAGEAAYRRLLEIFSLDSLVEASQLCRTMAGASNRTHEMLTRILVEEYGGGKLQRKHSSFFKVMLDDLAMNAAPEGYFERVPWEVLASINLSFLYSERKRFYLRYIGGLLYTEVSVPAGFNNYRIAGARLELEDKAMAYWDLHIKEDERHGRWMLYDVAMPLIEQYGADSWELILGYDQTRLMSARAGRAIAREARAADEQAASLPR